MPEQAIFCKRKYKYINYFGGGGGGLEIFSFNEALTINTKMLVM